MRPGRRLPWLLALALVALLAIGSVQSFTEHEGSPSDEFFDDSYDETYDYEGEEGDFESAKQEYAPPVGQYQHQLPAAAPPAYPPMPLPQYPKVSSYEQPQLQYQQQYEQPQVQYQQQQYGEQQQQQQQQQQYVQPQVYQANYSTPSYNNEKPVAYPQPVSHVYQKQEISYQKPVEVVYQKPVEVVYQKPVEVVYQKPVEVAYQKPVEIVYPQPQVSYQKQPEVSYQQPQQQQQVVVKQTYLQPIVMKQPVYVANYSQALAPSSYKPPVQVYTASSLAHKYSLTELASFTLPFNYRGNHWSLHYYKQLNYAKCPKGAYGSQRGPSHQDIEAAFGHALSRLGHLQQHQGGMQYMNSSSLSFAARHQISSFLSGKNARMDEEGLLVEFVSLYLADRLCMSKWDRQRYLPSLTKLVGANQFPQTHACSQYYSAGRNPWQWKNCYANKYRTYDGFCNNPQHPYWGKSNVCHIRLLSPDYADGISMPRESTNKRYELPNPRIIANLLSNDVPLEGPYNLMKMQWGQFINHDISQTALSSYDGLVDCCKQPHTRGCWPMPVATGDHFYGAFNITCLNFIRSGVCPTCQLGPRQQTNKNTAFLDASHVYGNSLEQANQLRAFAGGLLKSSSGRSGEQLLPVSTAQEQCVGTCYQAGDSRANQHPALTALHVLLLRNHNRHAQNLAKRHPNWTDEILFQEARRLNIAEYQMITYAEYLPIVFGPVLSAYYQLTPLHYGQTQYNPHVDPTTWNEYSTATCRFGHSQISSVFGLYSKIAAYGQPHELGQKTFRLKEWFFRPSFLHDGLIPQILNGLLARPSYSVDPWVTTDVRNHLYQTPREHFGGDLVATNIWRGRDHGLPGYVHYLEYCFNYKVRGWKDLQMFIPPYTLGQMRKVYRVVENVDLFTGGLAERHFPGADTGPTFACVNGIQYHHLKFGDRYYFEHANQAGSYAPHQIDEIRRSSLARLLCRTGNLHQVPQYAFLQPSIYNPLVNCSQLGDIDYNKF